MPMKSCLCWQDASPPRCESLVEDIDLGKEHIAERGVTADALALN